MDCSIAAKLVEMLRVSKCFGGCVCDCDLHDVTTPTCWGNGFGLYIFHFSNFVVPTSRRLQK